jgi:ABC-type multidrug transport system fused ATPase/permease subunit
VLENITFRLAPGSVLGLLGRTGSGKTSLIRLLMRLYDPATGVVSLGDVPLPELRLADLRRSVAVVTQDVQLFNASLRDNLTLFEPSLPDDRLITTLRELGLGEWYDGLSAGLDTRLGSGSGGGAGGDAGLSAGQAQLLALARVFLADPRLVILDEASSRLDPATEALIERAVDRLLVGRTAIVIAHHLTTVQRANEIMILSDGRIVEHGGRLALAGDPTSRFSGLLRTGLEEVLA